MPRTPRVNLSSQPQSPGLFAPNPLIQPNIRIGKSIAAKPEPYDGEQAKYIQWWRTVELYLAGFEEEPSDRQKVLIILSYMKGQNAAGRWADLYVTQGLNAVRSFDEFADQLKKMFQPPDIRRNAEKRLLALKQGKETVKDFMTRLKQLVIEAEYNVSHHSRLLINIMRNGIHNEIVEMVERSQPHLLNNASFSAWESALVQASAILQDIADRKRGTVQSTYQRPFGARPLPSTPAPSSSSSTVHPNQPGTFGGQGVPMDISKAHAEGKCFKCGQSWPCKEHFKPRQRQARTMVFRGVTIEYTNTDGLATAISKIEAEKLGFPTGQ